MCGTTPCSNCIKYFAGVPTGSVPESTWGIDTLTNGLYLYHLGVWLFIAGGAAPPSANPTGTVGPTVVNGVLASYMRSDAAPPIKANLILADILAVFDGAGAAITATKTIYIPVDFDCTILEATAVADQSGSVTVNVGMCTYAQFDAGVTHPVFPGDAIDGAAPLAIVAASKYQDAILTGWTTAIPAGNILVFQISVNATTITKVTAALKVTKT
jgi:hypothetical protein